MDLTNHSVLVAGGCGFIGGHFVRRLARSSNAKILVVDKLTYASNHERLQPLVDAGRIQFMQADIADQQQLYTAIAASQCDWVVNFAAESHVDRSIDGPNLFVQSNTVGAQRLAEAAYQYWAGTLAADARTRFRFLQVSTDEVYGSCEVDDPFVESQAYSPSSPYAASKAAADHLVMAYHNTYGMPVMISIGSNNFGPYQFPEKLIPLMIQRAVGGAPLPLYGSGEQRRDWLYVEDHCDALLQILQSGRPGEKYHVASGSNCTNRQIVESLCELVGKVIGVDNAAERIVSVVDRPGHDHCYAIDASKVRNEFGWEPAASFDQQLETTVQWYLGNLDWLNAKTQLAQSHGRLGLRGAEAYK